MKNRTPNVSRSREPARDEAEKKQEAVQENARAQGKAIQRAQSNGKKAKKTPRNLKKSVFRADLIYRFFRIFFSKKLLDVRICVESELVCRLA